MMGPQNTPPHPTGTIPVEARRSHRSPTVMTGLTLLPHHDDQRNQYQHNGHGDGLLGSSMAST